MRILIVKLSAMGDILHALAVLPYLHTAHPGIEVDWVVEEMFAGLLHGNPLITQLLTVNLKKWKKQPFSPETFHAVFAARSKLVERKYDIVFDIQGNIKSGVVTWLTGSAKRVGFDRRMTQERLNSLFTNFHVSSAAEQHVTDQYLRIVSSQFELDFHQLDLPTTIFVNDEDAVWAEKFISNNSTGRSFLFHTGTTWQTKFWYKEGWILLGQYLLKQYAGSTIYFSWGNRTEQGFASEVVEALGAGAVLLEKLSLGRLAALVKKVDLVVGGDTGVVHMAAVVGTPTVSYYRSSDGLRSGPRGQKDWVIQSPLPCSRCFKTTCDKDRECRQSITPEMLFEAAQRVLA